MYEYLKTFMNVLMSTYRASEMIDKDIFQYTKLDGPLSCTFSTIVSFVPMIGELACSLVDL